MDWCGATAAMAVAERDRRAVEWQAAARCRGATRELPNGLHVANKGNAQYIRLILLHDGDKVVDKWLPSGSALHCS